MVNLDVRLKAVYDMVGESESLLDVGSDHGYLPIQLFKNNMIKRAVISDVNEGPLLNARENFSKMFKEEKDVTFVLSDGMKNIDTNNIETLCICGMGGELIIDILNYDLEKTKGFKTIILQPMNSVDMVRKYLYDSSFTIVDEDLIRDRHHFYNVLKVLPKKDDEKYEDVFFDLGYKLYEKGNENFLDFLNYKIKVNKKIVENCKNKNTENAKEALNKAKDYIILLERVKENYESKRYNKIH